MHIYKNIPFRRFASNPKKTMSHKIEHTNSYFPQKTNNTKVVLKYWKMQIFDRNNSNLSKNVKFAKKSLNIWDHIIIIGEIVLTKIMCSNKCSPEFALRSRIQSNKCMDNVQNAINWQSPTMKTIYLLHGNVGETVLVIQNGGITELSIIITSGNITLK